MTYLDFEKKYGLTSDQSRGFESIKEIDLSKETELPDYFCIKVESSLDLTSLETFPSVFCPIVSGSIDLSQIQYIPYFTKFEPVVGGNLLLDNAITLSNIFAPVIGRCLMLQRIETLPNNFNPVIGGQLYRGSLRDPLNIDKFNNKDGGFKLQTANGKDYIWFECFLWEVVKAHNYHWEVKRIEPGLIGISYLSTDKNGHYAISTDKNESFDELTFVADMPSMEELAFYYKTTNRAFKECVKIFRIINGLSRDTMKEYIKHTGLHEKSYTIQEMIEWRNTKWVTNRMKFFFSN